MRARKNSRTKFISFSGIDGAGKSTQIRNLCDMMTEMGVRFRVVQFWDDVAMFTRFRESASHTLFKSERGIGTPSAPVNRRDKNVRSWRMTAVRLCLYFADAASTWLAVRKASQSSEDVIVFDRYIYDQLANLNLKDPFIRAYVRLIMKFVPRPEISYLLDAVPAKARARKPEYPLDFLHTCRASYMALCDLIGGVTVIAPMPVGSVKREVLRRALTEMPFPGVQTTQCPSEQCTNNPGESVVRVTISRPSAN